jgi:hypothetical protein
MAGTASFDRERAFKEVLGAAVAHVWGELPEAVQEKLFAHAVTAGGRSEQDERLREELARCLHDHHPRTAHTDKQ